MEEKYPSKKGWWFARIRMKWPENAEPSWYLDLLIAHKIIAPVLYQQCNNITLWRVHRRAARDDEGHQFSLIFYSSPETARQIFTALQFDKLLKKMKKAGVVIQDIYDNPDKVTTPHVEDASDGNWAVPIKKSWPFFIMGVCQMWLSLIVEISEGSLKEQKITSLQKMLAFYRQVDNDIKMLWRDQGCHALLHHLNAIFGYEPVLIREAHLRRF